MFTNSGCWMKVYWRKRHFCRFTIGFYAVLRSPQKEILHITYWVATHNEDCAKSATSAVFRLKPIVLNLFESGIIQSLQHRTSSLYWCNAVYSMHFQGCVSCLAQIVGSASRRLAWNYALRQNTTNPLPLFACNWISVQIKPDQRGQAPTSKLEIEVQKFCRWEAPDRCRTVNHELRTSELMVSVSCAQLKHKRKLPHFKFLIPTICCHHSSFPLQL